MDREAKVKARRRARRTSRTSFAGTVVELVIPHMSVAVLGVRVRVQVPLRARTVIAKAKVEEKAKARRANLVAAQSRLISLSMRTISHGMRNGIRLRNSRPALAK